AQDCLQRARQKSQNPVVQYVSELNSVELDIIEDRLNNAKIRIDDFLNWQNIYSDKVALVYPITFCIRAKISSIEGDVTSMISHLSLALAESSMFPHAFHEFQIISYALELMKANSISQKQREPLFKAMVFMLEAKDWYTGRGHSSAVANFATALWDTWQYKSAKPALREDLYWAAYLHDIGKIKLPRSLLNKIAPLSDKEFKLLRKHPVYSQEILDEFGAHSIAKLAGEHHQDAQGRGYPGNEPASPMGLCIALADIIEAATSAGRVYRTPKTLGVVLEELAEMGPERYPTGLVDAVQVLCTIKE
ncbi:HD-GYP domain-containing protein, partial [candidate division CSSED10-310 bacterium]